MADCLLITFNSQFLVLWNIVLALLVDLLHHRLFISLVICFTELEVLKVKGRNINWRQMLIIQVCLV